MFPWSVVLLERLDIDISLKASVGSVVLWQHLDMQLPFAVPVGSVCGLSFCCNILIWIPS